MSCNTQLSPQKLRYSAAVFDLDGVITQTSDVHLESWKQLFDEFLANRDGDNFKPFTQEDYNKYVDGRPRYDGVKKFLESRGISIELGKSDDSPDKETICGLGNKKNTLFQKVITEKGVVLYDSTIQFIKQLVEKKVKVAVATSSKNGKKILEITKVRHLFNVEIDGNITESMGLCGKPEPDIFLECCKIMKVHPEESLLVEDATSGVDAGKRGHFGLVIGVDRVNHREDLLRYGADIVINDFSEVSIWSINDAFPYASTEWTLNFDITSIQHEKLVETLTTLGNGYMATRGSSPEAVPME